MENELINYISRFIDLTGNEKRAIAENTPVITFKKGTMLLREHEIADKCWFILKGCVRQFHITDGDEKTTFFYTEEQAIDPSESFNNQKHAGYYLECTEQTTVAETRLDSIPDTFEHFPKFEKLTLLLMGSDHSETKESFAAFKSSTPKERYLQLLKDRPGLIQRVPQHQIASYLGVTPESLSRIRKRITDKDVG